MPRDADGTYNRVAGGTLRAGVTPHSTFIDVDDAGRVSGSEADVIRSFAEEIGAEVEFEIGSERQLMELMENGDIDIVAGGFTEDSPWSTHMALTRPYTTSEGGDDVVMGVRPGENRMLVNLETYLARHAGELR